MPIEALHMKASARPLCAGACRRLKIRLLDGRNGPPVLPKLMVLLQFGYTNTCNQSAVGGVANYADAGLRRWHVARSGQFGHRYKLKKSNVKLCQCQVGLDVKAEAVPHRVWRRHVHTKCGRSTTALDVPIQQQSAQNPEQGPLELI